MLITVTGYSLQNSIITIYGTDTSEENLQRMERMRSDIEPREMAFAFNTKYYTSQRYIWMWLKNQKATANATTWGEALSSIIGTVTEINKRYRIYREEK
jgi:hypothetical protein